jgi:hypothetical protein
MGSFLNISANGDRDYVAQTRRRLRHWLSLFFPQQVLLGHQPDRGPFFTDTDKQIQGVDMLNGEVTSMWSCSNLELPFKLKSPATSYKGSKLEAVSRRPMQ